MQEGLGNPTETGGNGKWKRTAERVTDEASASASRLAETAQKVYHRAVEAGNDLMSQARRKTLKMAREYPVQTALGGLALGMFLGATLFRRRS